MRLNYLSRWLKPLWAALLCLMFLGGGPWRQPEVYAQTSSQESARPLLNIEAGMHIARIRAISVDAAGRYLVTGSDDKTIRVWEVATGRLLRTLRPTIGASYHGFVNAVAISPDGRLIAVGGTTDFWSGEGYNLFVFDRETGAIVKQQKVAFRIINLTFSPDGTKLAAGCLGEEIKIFNVSGAKLSLLSPEAPEMIDKKHVVIGIDFDRAGRVVTAGDDGYLRLYDQNLKLLMQVRAPGMQAAKERQYGQWPRAVRFSPDGSKLAVGYSDIARVDVVDSNYLEPLYQPDTSGVSNGDLSSVAWSADGSALYAAGDWHSGTGAYLIRRWADAGRGRYLDSVAAGDSIVELAPAPNGGVIFASVEPSWGVFSAKGERLRFVGRETADHRDSQASFGANETGGVVGFAYESSGKSPAWFSVPDRRLKTGEVNRALRPARIDGLPIQDWKDNDVTTLNGQIRLLLLSGDVSRSLAIAPDAQSFLLAGDRSMKLFTQNGNDLWIRRVPGPARSVNISGNGKLAIGAFADGTIRWYRMSDGKELLAFFPYKDRKRWVLWTPSGYYDCSPGARDLIGWHVSANMDQAADFFPIGRFRDVYYRPDVISRILETGDEEEALKQANEKSGRNRRKFDLKKRLPPVINIISPADDSEIGSRTVVVRYSLRSPSGAPVTGVKVLIDGRPAGVERGIGARLQNGGTGDQTSELTVSVPSRDCEIGLVAENKYASSVVSSTRLRWRGASEADLIKPKLYILAVGVAQYRNPSWNLTYAAKDARDFVEAMRSQEGSLYDRIEVKLLTDQQATKDNILDGLEWIQSQTTSRDVAMVFFAGHGVNDNLNRYFFCSHNFEEESLMRTGVAYSDFKSAVETIAGKALFFVDTCHAGNVISAKSRGGAADVVGLVNELSSVENGVIVFTAATARQNSLEDAQWSNGAFTRALVEGLTGAADLKKQGKITVTMLDFFVAERVKELTGGRQTPATVKPETVPDFPIAIVK